MIYPPIQFINKSKKTGAIICLHTEAPPPSYLNAINRHFSIIEAQGHSVTGIGVSLPMLNILYRYSKAVCDFTRPFFSQCHDYINGDIAGQMWTADIIIDHDLADNEIAYFFDCYGIRRRAASYRY